VAKAPSQIRSLARAHTETAINVLVGIMNQNEAPPPARVSAASALLDRGWGKPTQPIAGDDDADAIRLEVIKRMIVDPKGANDDPGNPDSSGVSPAT
jgi:hypothetical protein